MSTYYYLNTELDTRFDIWKKDLDKLKDFTGSEEEKTMGLLRKGVDWVNHKVE